VFWLTNAILRRRLLSETSWIFWPSISIDPEAGVQKRSSKLSVVDYRYRKGRRALLFCPGRGERDAAKNIEFIDIFEGDVFERDFARSNLQQRPPWNFRFGLGRSMISYSIDARRTGDKLALNTRQAAGWFCGINRAVTKAKNDPGGVPSSVKRQPV